VVEFLLALYPESANEVTSRGCNLLHLAVTDDASRAVAKVRYLCARYPGMMQQRDIFGWTPAHKVSSMPGSCDIAKVLYEAGGIDQFRTPVAHPTNATHAGNGYLPLHLFIGNLPTPDLQDDSHVTPVDADMLRWLLRMHPEAAGIEGCVCRKTPYQLAVDGELPDDFLRLLFSAAPALNPPELHRLNYAERRMAMFLAFRGTTARKQAPFALARFRGGNKDIMQHVVSFL
jgi:hypothetical protein